MSDRLSRRELRDPFAHLLLGEDSEDLIGGVELDGRDHETFVADNGAFLSIEEPLPGVTDDQSYDDAQMHAADAASGGSDMNAATILRGMQAADARALSLPVTTVPTSWDRGILGRKAEVSPSQDITQPGALVQLVFWPGDDRESVPVAVTVQPVTPLVNGLVAPFVTTGQRPVARIVWGTRDGQFSADIDVGNGIELSLCASSVYVGIYLDAGSPFIGGSPAVFAGAIGFQTVAPNNFASRTAYLDVIVGAAVVDILRPPFASSIIEFTRSVAGGQWTLDFLSNSTTQASVGQVIIAATTYPRVPIPLPNDVVIIRVTNNGAQASARLVFGLF